MSLKPRTLIAATAIAALAFPAAASAKTKPSYYVSLGDSYAQGVQPIGPNQADIATNKGFNDDAYKKLHKSNKKLKLVKLGCGGATTDSMINGTKPCIEKLPYKSKSKATSQLTYAKKFLKAHKAQIAYVSVVIGGNDFAKCANEPDNNAVIACLGPAVAQMKKNLPVIAKAVRSSAGKKAKIVGLTYPDVVLGAWVRSENGKNLAKASVPVFKDQINPALKGAYSKQKIGFVDATTAFGAYIPFEQTTMLAPYGTIPQNVANICTLGWYCNARTTPDIHLKPAGYSKLAGLLLTQFKKQK
jgi:lysophospholipase L1-like esterase